MALVALSATAMTPWKTDTSAGLPSPLSLAAAPRRMGVSSSGDAGDLMSVRSTWVAGWGGEGWVGGGGDLMSARSAWVAGGKRVGGWVGVGT